MNLKELRNEILKDNSDTLNNADITGWINRGLDELSLVARFKKTISFPLIENQTDYKLPSDFLKNVIVSYTKDSISSKLPYLTLSNFHQTGYKIIGNTLSIQNLKNVSSINLVYEANLPHLVSDTDIPAIPIVFHDLLVLYTLTRTKYKDQIDDLQSIAMNDYMRRKNELIEYVKNLEARPRKVIDVYGDWL